MEKVKGELSSHEEGTPKQKLFVDKDTGIYVNGQIMESENKLINKIYDSKEIDENPVQNILTVKTANQWIDEASQRPDPKPLWLPLWNEGEIACLFADSNLGKSIYGVEIADEIAKHQKVIYCDFELSDKQFQLRYTGAFAPHRFPDDLLRVEIDPMRMMNSDNFEDEIIYAIESIAVREKAKVIIIDNLTYLCNDSSKGDLAGILMIHLMSLKKRYGWSILVLAHTPKRNLSSPITQNDLAGSKKLFNFFDSVFAIGKSAKDENLRYIKQLKVRAGKFEYDSTNVLVCEIEKDDSFLHFKPIGCMTEEEHLKGLSSTDNSKINEEVRRLRDEGKPIRVIADILNLSKSKVSRIMSKLED